MKTSLLNHLIASFLNSGDSDAAVEILSEAHVRKDFYDFAYESILSIREALIAIGSHQ